MDVFQFLGRVFLGGAILYGIFVLLPGVMFFIFGDDGFSWRGLGTFLVFLAMAIGFLVGSFYLGDFLVALF